MPKKPTKRKRATAKDSRSKTLSPFRDHTVGLKTSRKGGRTRSEAMDYFQNLMARMGTGTPSLPEATQYEMERLSNNYWLMLTLYRNHWIARRIVDLPAQDMTRAWPRLQCELSPDDIKDFDRTVARTYTANQILKTLKWSRLYGGAGALMAIKGHEDILDKPLDYDDINPGDYMGLIPFDRWVGIYPSGNVMDEYKHPADWGLPEYYECRAPDSGTDFKVHSSRILRFCGPEVPTPELQAQMYWGISELEVVWEELKKRDNASFAILQLLFRANIIAQVNPELASLLSGLGTSQQALQRWTTRMQAQNELMSNQSMLILGKDADMKSVQYSFSGMGEVYAQFQMDTAGAAEIPVTRLFGKTITGLGQSNDADERYYEEKIAAKQASELRPQLDKLYPVICMSELGEVPDDLDYKFPSVRVLTEEEKGDIVQKASAPVLAAFNSGVIGKKTALKELKQMGDQTNIFTNITDEAIDEASDEPEIPGEGEMLGGEGGEEPEEGEKANNKQEGSGGPAKGGPEAKAGKKEAAKNPQQLMKKAAAGAEDEEEITWVEGGKGVSPLVLKKKKASKDDNNDEAEFIEIVYDAVSEAMQHLKTAYSKDEKHRIQDKRKWHGLDVSIENKAGSTRRGKDPKHPWQIEMQNDYGYLRSTEGVDGDAVDVFMGPDPDAKFVFVIHTLKAPDFKEFDEDKCMLDFATEADARDAFFANYDKTDHYGKMEKFPVDEFIKKVKSTKGNPRPVSKVVDADSVCDVCHYPLEDGFCKRDH